MSKDNASAAVAELEQAAVAVEEDVKDLRKDVGDDLVGIDLDLVDLSLPADYELRAVAIQRLASVREAVKARIDLAANKAAGSQQHVEQIEKSYAALRWAVAIIDKRYPAAAKLSKQMGEDIAAQETASDAEARRKRTDARR